MMNAIKLYYNKKCMLIIKINQKLNQKVKINIIFLDSLDSAQNQTPKIKILFTKN